MRFVVTRTSEINFSINEMGISSLGGIANDVRDWVEDTTEDPTNAIVSYLNEGYWPGDDTYKISIYDDDEILIHVGETI